MAYTEEYLVYTLLQKALHEFEEAMHTTTQLYEHRKRTVGLIGKSVLFAKAMMYAQQQQQEYIPFAPTQHFLIEKGMSRLLHFIKKHHLFSALLLYHVQEETIMTSQDAGWERRIMGVSLGSVVPYADVYVSDVPLHSAGTLCKAIERTIQRTWSQSGIRTMQCSHEIMRILDFLFERNLIFIIASGAPILVYDIHVGQRKKTTRFKRGKYFVRLYSWHEMWLHVLPKTTSKKPVRFYTNIDIDTVALQEVYTQAAIKSNRRKDCLRHVPLSTLQYLKTLPPCLLWWISSLVAVLNNYKTVLIKNGEKRTTLEGYYSSFCNRNGLTKNTHSFIKYLGVCVERYSMKRYEYEHSKVNSSERLLQESRIEPVM